MKKGKLIVGIVAVLGFAVYATCVDLPKVLAGVIWKCRYCNSQTSTVQGQMPPAKWSCYESPTGYHEWYRK